MKIYTRTGDDGTTGVLGPGRLPKHAARIEAYGTVDELNACLGVARAIGAGPAADARLGAVQAALFRVGALLATTDPAAAGRLPVVTEDEVAAFEGAIDELERDLPPLRHFVLPGGAPLAAQIHFARTVCRRAERRVTALAEAEPVDLVLVRYLNRLGDYLFVLARWCNHRAGVPETEWRGGA